MTPSEEVDYILHDCLFAVGQAVGAHAHMDYDAVAWLRGRYRERFLFAMTARGNSWMKDRDRVTAVGRYLGERALFHAGSTGVIDVHAIAKAADDVECGCRMNAIRDAVVTDQRCTNSGDSAF
jgi:hypothetical protein